MPLGNRTGTTDGKACRDVPQGQRPGGKRRGQRYRVHSEDTYGLDRRRLETARSFFIKLWNPRHVKTLIERHRPYTEDRFRSRSHTCGGPTFYMQGAQDSPWNGDSRPLMRKPENWLRAPTFRGGFTLDLSGAELFCALGAVAQFDACLPRISLSASNEKRASHREALN